MQDNSRVIVENHHILRDKAIKPGNGCPIGMETNDKLRGAAFHEAGHVIVAREFGLTVGGIAIGVDSGLTSARSAS
jgi:hypothetical protein